MPYVSDLLLHLVEKFLLDSRLCGQDVENERDENIRRLVASKEKYQCSTEDFSIVQR